MSFLDQEIIVTSILEKPYLFRTVNSNGEVEYSGFCYDLLVEIQNLFATSEGENIFGHRKIPRFKIRIVEDNKYGRKIVDPNTGEERWDGMIGEVLYGKASLAVAPISITSSRESVIQFTKPFMNLGISIMIKKPEKKNYEVFGFLEPLGNEVWASVAVSYIGVSILLFVVTKYLPNHEKMELFFKNRCSSRENSNSIKRNTHPEFTVSNCFWYSLGALLGQGMENLPINIAGRVLSGVWWFFSLIIVSSYTANLAAFLTVTQMQMPIQSVQDLAYQSSISYGMLGSGSTYEFFEKAAETDATIRLMKNHMIDSGIAMRLTNSTKQGIQQVREMDGKFAFLLESSRNDYEATQQPCDTMRVGDTLDSKGYGIVLPKNSLIYNDINLAVLKLSENGKLRRLQTWVRIVPNGIAINTVFTFWLKY